MFEDELGFSEEESKQAQRGLEKTARQYSEQEGEKMVRLFFEFETSEKRNAARATLDKLREERKDYDDIFRYFVGCQIDSNRPDVGLEIRFSKNIPDIEEKIEALLAEYQIIPTEEYETIDDQPVPEKTKINRNS